MDLRKRLDNVTAHIGLGSPQEAAVKEANGATTQDLVHLPHTSAPMMKAYHEDMANHHKRCLHECAESGNTAGVAYHHPEYAAHKTAAKRFQDAISKADA